MYLSRKYQRYLRSKAWKEKSRLVRDRDGGKCLACPSKVRVVAHHGTYERVGNENLADLFSLCGSCHMAVHAICNTRGPKPDLLSVTKEFIRAKSQE